MTTPPRKLRSNFPKGSYLWAVRNAQWQAMGIPEEDCEKPKIAVVNSSSELAAARLNVPTVMVPCGYQASGEYKGQHVDIEEVFIQSMHAQIGSTPVDEVVAMSRCAIRSPGVCSGLGTANTMHIVCEALGM